MAGVGGRREDTVEAPRTEGQKGSVDEAQPTDAPIQDVVGMRIEEQLRRSRPHLRTKSHATNLPKICLPPPQQPRRNVARCVGVMPSRAERTVSCNCAATLLPKTHCI